MKAQLGQLGFPSVAVKFTTHGHDGSLTQPESYHDGNVGCSSDEHPQGQDQTGQGCRVQPLVQTVSAVACQPKQGRHGPIGSITTIPKPFSPMLEPRTLLNGQTKTLPTLDNRTKDPAFTVGGAAAAYSFPLLLAVFSFESSPCLGRVEHVTCGSNAMVSNECLVLAPRHQERNRVDKREGSQKETADHKLLLRQGSRRRCSHDGRCCLGFGNHVSAPRLLLVAPLPFSSG